MQSICLIWNPPYPSIYTYQFPRPHRVWNSEKQDLDGCFGNLVIFGNDETIKNKTNNYNLKLILQAAMTKQSGFLLELYKPRKTPNY